MPWRPKGAAVHARRGELSSWQSAGNRRGGDAGERSGGLGGTCGGKTSKGAAGRVWGALHALFGRNAEGGLCRGQDAGAYGRSGRDRSATGIGRTGTARAKGECREGETPAEAARVNVR